MLPWCMRPSWCIPCVSVVRGGWPGLAEEELLVNRLARVALLTLALLCLFTIGAGASVAGLLPDRLALFQLPQVAGGGLAPAGGTLAAASGVPRGGAAATTAGVTAQIAGLLAGGGLGAHYGALVENLGTGQVLYSLNATTGFTPASTTKVATAVAALHVLGPSARFTTSVRQGASAAQIVLAGGGDPTLSAGPYPAGSYPEPASLKALAAATAAALRAKGTASVSLGYADSIFSGPEQADGWPAIGTANNYISSGNVTPITGLEVDQGRLTGPGRPEDTRIPGGGGYRSWTPSLDAAQAFAGFLRRDGITVTGSQSPVTGQPAGPVLAQVQSPVLSQIVEWMLQESNNAIAETLARQVALATGKPGTFSGAASAVMATDRALGVTGISLVDGSGLSPLDSIEPQALVRLIGLTASAAQPALRPALTGLPVSEFSGTLAPSSFFARFGPAGLGTIRAKTGNLSLVATLTGLAYAKNGQLLAFAFMGDQLNKKTGLTTAGFTLAELATAVAGCGCR